MYYPEITTMEPGKYSGSLFNQKYFESYRRAITMDESGKMRVEFVYEGIYYTRDIPENLSHKLCYILIPLTCIAGMIWAMAVRTPMNYSKGVMFFQILLLFLLFLNLICGTVRCSAREKLTRWEYRMSSLSVKEISVLCVLISAGLFITSLARYFMGLDLLRNIYRGLIIYLMAAILQSILMAFTMRDRYLETESEDILNGIDVTNELSPMDNPDDGYWR